MSIKNWKPWALGLSSAGVALMLVGSTKLGFALGLTAGIMFEVANALNGGKYFD